MKRSTAPSSLFKKHTEKKIKPEDEDENGSVSPPEKENKVNRPSKNAPEKKVNHLQQWAPVKEETKANGEDEEVETKSEVITNKQRGKNIKMDAESRPIFFAISFQVKGGGQSGHGLIKVSYESVILFDEEGKQIGQSALIRDEDDDVGQKVMIKKKEVFFQEGYHVLIGSKIVTILSPVSEEEFQTGSFFMQDFKKSLEKAKAAAIAAKPTIRLAAARKPTGFVVPFKGAKSSEKRNVKPLHPPNASNALVLFTPKDLFSENKIHVVVDPILCQSLRPHQREGIQFLFDCVCMGNFDPITKKDIMVAF